MIGLCIQAMHRYSSVILMVDNTVYNMPDAISIRFRFVTKLQFWWKSCLTKRAGILFCKNEELRCSTAMKRILKEAWKLNRVDRPTTAAWHVSVSRKFIFCRVNIGHLGKSLKTEVKDLIAKDKLTQNVVVTGCKKSTAATIFTRVQGLPGALFCTTTTISPPPYHRPASLLLNAVIDKEEEL